MIGKILSTNTFGSRPLPFPEAKLIFTAALACGPMQSEATSGKAIYSSKPTETSYRFDGKLHHDKYAKHHSNRLIDTTNLDSGASIPPYFTKDQYELTKMKHTTPFNFHIGPLNGVTQNE